MLLIGFILWVEFRLKANRTRLNYQTYVGLIISGGPATNTAAI